VADREVQQRAGREWIEIVARLELGARFGEALLLEELTALDEQLFGGRELLRGRFPGTMSARATSARWVEMRPKQRPIICQRSGETVSARR
jgi:hypothetical protein